jgi:hypothetical protein
LVRGSAWERKVEGAEASCCMQELSSSVPQQFFVGPGSSALTFVGCESGPCPWCGAPSGVIPDGVLNVDADDVVRLSAALPSTDTELIKLAGILQAADLSQGADLDPVLARIEAEVNGANQLLVLLRDPAFGGATAFLALVLALLTFLGVHA